MKLTSSYNLYSQKPLISKRFNKNNQNTMPPQKPVSFGSISALALCYGAALYTAVSLFAASHLSNTTTRTSYNPKITSKNGWAENVKVLASNSQRYISFSIDEEAFSKTNATVHTAYSNELLFNLKKENTQGLIDAHKSINKIVRGDTLSGGFHIDPKIYKNENLFPITTPQELDCWNKNDKTKQRFILAISGSEDIHTQDMNVFSNQISEIYNIPEFNVIKVEDANKNSIKKGLKKLSVKIKDLNKDNAEILIYYHGHGQVKNGHFLGWTSHLKKEGAAKGRTEVGLKEEDLKKFTKENINGINTLIVMDTCHSGAWIC